MLQHRTGFVTFVCASYCGFQCDTDRRRGDKIKMLRQLAGIKGYVGAQGTTCFSVEEDLQHLSAPIAGDLNANSRQKTLAFWRGVSSGILSKIDDNYQLGQSAEGRCILRSSRQERRRSRKNSLKFNITIKNELLRSVSRNTTATTAAAAVTAC